jgi:hypothetical protein
MKPAEVDALMRQAVDIARVYSPSPSRLIAAERSLTLRCPRGWTLACWLLGKPGRLGATSWTPQAVWIERSRPGRTTLVELPPGWDVACLRAWLVPDPGPQQREIAIREVLRRLRPEAERLSRPTGRSGRDKIPAGKPAFPDFWGSGERPVDTRTTARAASRRP